MNLFGGSEPRLPFPTKLINFHGRQIEEYVIPDDKRAEVLDIMYLFDPVPSLDEQRFDLHSGKLFTVRDYRVTREDDHNWLVSPFYEEGGGTVIDWMPASWADPESEEDWEDEEYIEAELEDGDNSSHSESKNVHVSLVASPPVLDKLRAYMKQQEIDRMPSE